MATTVDHGKGVNAVALALQPIELLVFGNPKGGTPVMQSDQRVGIELPLGELPWQDESGQTWLSMTIPESYEAIMAWDKLR